MTNPVTRDIECGSGGHRYVVRLDTGEEAAAIEVCRAMAWRTELTAGVPMPLGAMAAYLDIAARITAILDRSDRQQHKE